MQDLAFTLLLAALLRLEKKDPVRLVALDKTLDALLERARRGRA